MVLGRAELFTENTVTPVSVVLTDWRRLPNMLRLWAVVFVSNIIGAMIFAFVVAHGEILSPAAFDLLFEEVASKMQDGFWTLTLKAVFGGWIVALVVWMVAASQDTVSQVLFIWLLILLIPAIGLPHCIASSTEFLVSVFVGQISWLEYLGGFLLPATVGNALGGFFLVTLLNYGQVVGSRRILRVRRR